MDIDQFKPKGGAELVEEIVRAHPHDALSLIAWADAIDPHYAKVGLTFFAGMWDAATLRSMTATFIPAPARREVT